MHPYLGSIIREERIRQDIKQEVLCHKICTPSYLSKIESNQANPSDDILVLLFDRLDIKFISDIPNNALQHLFDEISNCVLYEAYDSDLRKKFKNELHKFKYSKYYWEIYIHELLLSDTTHNELSSSLPNQLQYHPFVSVWYSQTHINPDKIDEAIRRLLLSQGQDDTGIVDFSLAQSYFYAGEFDKSYDCAQRSLSTFASLGNIRMMMYAHFQMGNTIIYSSFAKALSHFESCRRIAKICDDSQIISDLDYNLSADYLDLYFKYENIDDLLKAQNLILSAYTSSSKNSLYHFEKIILIHLYLNDYDSAASYFEKMKLTDDTWKGIAEYHALEYAISHSAFYLDRGYADLIESILDLNLKSNIYTRAIFIQNMLIFIYKKQKRYKRALTLTNFPSNH
ncbi:MAG: helix-turn-helix transcriptional regulator [Erysipelothrix sp.]